MLKSNRDALDSAYREAQHAIRRATEAAEVEAHREIASGKGSVNPAFYSGRIIEAARVAMDAAVENLITAHIQAGDRSESTITERIRALVNQQVTGRLPARDSRNVGAQMRNEANSKARFEMVRSGLANRVKDLVATALLKERAATTLAQRVEKWASNNRVIAAAIVSAAAIAAIWKVVEIVIGAAGKIRPLFH